jgi:4-hydroxymandelate oxidase
VEPEAPLGPLNVFDYERIARERLAPSAWAYYSDGAGDRVTLRANRAAFERIQIVPRMLRGVKTADTRATVLGTVVGMPLLVAPMAAQGLACPEGEVATARATGAAGTLMIAATEANRPLAEIVAAATGPLWYQLYVYQGRRAMAERHVRAAEAAGCRALVVTVDAPRWGRKETSERDEFVLPAGMGWGNFEQETDDIDLEPEALAWDDIDWLRSLTTLPLVLKGLLAADDAREAVAHGVDGIVVSNHGGRQLDATPASITVLPEIVAAVDGRCEVYLDSGIRRGTDVLKALALGAQAVLLGRPVLWGLAANGADGARRVLELLRDELELAMALAGVGSVAEIAALGAKLVRMG